MLSFGRHNLKYMRSAFRKDIASNSAVHFFRDTYFCLCNIISNPVDLCKKQNAVRYEKKSKTIACLSQRTFHFILKTASPKHISFLNYTKTLLATIELTAFLHNTAQKSITLTPSSKHLSDRSKPRKKKLCKF